MPSQHTAECIAASLTFDPSRQLVAIPFAAFVGGGRVMAKKHHIGDVLAGTMIGCAAAYLTSRVEGQLRRSRTASPGT